MSRRGDTGWLAGSLGLVALCLLPTLQFGLLAWDDKLHLSAVSARDWLLTPQLGYPIPVTVASYALDAALAGGFHLSQVIYQLIVCGLYFLLSRRLGLSPPAAALALLLFALHPASAEPVSWVSGRKDVLAGLFGLLAVGLALREARWAWPASVLCYALALLSKPSAAPLFVFAVALAPSPSQPPARLADARYRLLRGVPYLLVLAPIAWLGVHGQQSVGALAESLPESSRLQQVWYALAHHLRVLLLWEETTAKYIPAVWPPVFSARVDLVPPLCAACVVLALWFTRGSRVVVLGAAWALLTYLPSSGVFFELSRFLADSYLYLPLMGAGWVAAGVFDHALGLLRPALRRVVMWLPCACALALAPAFVVSSARFADDEALWTHALGRFPGHRRICRQWANAVADKRGAEAGLAATDACIARFGPELFARNRAVLLGRLGRHD
jgi:protein O-mannosyl-transferase